MTFFVPMSCSEQFFKLALFKYVFFPMSCSRSELQIKFIFVLIYNYEYIFEHHTRKYISNSHFINSLKGRPPVPSHSSNSEWTNMMDGRVMVMDFSLKKKRPIGQGAVFVGQVKATSNAFSPCLGNNKQ